MTDSYKYTEEWVKKNDNEGTLKVTEVQPAIGQSKNNVRSIEYDCSVEDLKAGLENLKKTRNKSYGDYQEIVNAEKDILNTLSDKKYSMVVTPEMNKIMGIIENASLLGQLEAKKQDKVTALSIVEQDNEKIKIREEVLSKL